MKLSERKALDVLIKKTSSFKRVCKSLRYTVRYGVSALDGSPHMLVSSPSGSFISSAVVRSIPDSLEFFFYIAGDTGYLCVY